MAGRGVHFAITEEQASALNIAADDDALREIIEQIEEEEWEASFACQTDKAWDAIHRTLTNGELSWNGGEEPLKWVILGAPNLHEGRDYIICLLNPDMVQAVAAEIGNIDEAEFRRRYNQLEFPGYQGDKSEEDLAYSWGWLKNLPPFFKRAADAGRHVVFTVDQ